jgi:hypothetical protein
MLQKKLQNCKPDCSKNCKKKHTQPHSILKATKHTHTQNQTPKLQQKTQNHIVLDCRKKTKQTHREGARGTELGRDTKPGGGSLFNVC